MFLGGGIGSHGAGVTAKYELPNKDAGNQTNCFFAGATRAFFYLLVVF